MRFWQLSRLPQVGEAWILEDLPHRHAGEPQMTRRMDLVAGPAECRADLRLPGSRVAFALRGEFRHAGVLGGERFVDELLA